MKVILDVDRELLSNRDIHEQIKAAITRLRLTEEKPPEPEVWTAEGMRIRDPENETVAVANNPEAAQRIASLPTLEREHAELVSAAKRVVREHYRMALGHADCSDDENAAIVALDALVEGKP